VETVIEKFIFGLVNFVLEEHEKGNNSQFKPSLVFSK
jgi:hypothetical protein